MREVISRFTGSPSASIVMGPKPGVDVSVLRISSSRVMVVSCDPVSFISSIGPEASARMSVYEIASDVATTGIPPKYAMIDLNIPPGMTDGVLTTYWKSFDRSCRELGLSIVGGHTGRFEGCDYSVVGGATLWALCGNNEYVTSMMAKDGDDIILTKSAAYGATSVFAQAFPRTVRRALGNSLYEKARKYFLHSNTVMDSLTAAGYGIHEQGVTAMHDATEGGVLAALIEIAEASGLGGTIMLDDIPVSDETRELCKFFGIDPLVSLGEGCLVIACRPRSTSRILHGLQSKGIRSTIVGKLSADMRGLQGRTRKGTVPLRYPKKDPYWQVYWKAVRKKWS